jgi:hypothetical protein
VDYAGREVPTEDTIMAQVDWYMEGVEFSNCNCDYACPCQFESPLPTHGDCRGFAAVRIDKGHFGEVPLDGLCGAVLYAWPGPIYKGNGERATASFRASLTNEPTPRNETRSLRCCTAARRTRGRPTGGSIG